MSIMQQVNKLDPPGRFLVEEASQADCSGADNVAAAASSSSNKSNTVDPQVLQKVWVPASNDKIVRKILHRLCELKGLKVEEPEPQETTSQNEFDMQATDDIVSTSYNLANAATDPDTNLADDTMLDFLNDPLVDNHDNNSTAVSQLMATANTNFEFDEGTTSEHNNGSWEESTAAAAATASFATAAFAAGTGLPLNNNQEETDMAVGGKKP